jgi:hypothetical protein
VRVPAKPAYPNGVAAEPSDRTAERSDAVSDASDATPEGSDATPEGSGAMSEGSGVMPEASGAVLEASGMTPDRSGAAAEASGALPDRSGATAESSGEIASAGDNAFALLAAGAEEVAADLSPAQLSLVELKSTAVRRLSYPEALAFLRARTSPDRRPVYEQLERDLSERTREFWRSPPEAVAGGVIHHGKFESYFRLFRERVLPLVHRRKTVLSPRRTGRGRAHPLL